MKYPNILLALLFTPFIMFGQNKEVECAEYEPIEMFNLRKALIKKQNLDVWPNIVEIKNLSVLQTKRKDSLILFIAETEFGDKLRLTNSSDLSKFAEISFNNDCKQAGTILTDLKFGKINLAEMKAEIFCKQKKYAVLKIKN